MAKIFIGVGHGGFDSGAVGNGLKEKDLNLAIALACADELKRYGITVGMSRTKDENDDINEEIKECNAFNPDYAVDIHNNAGGGDGGEVFYSCTGEGKALAENINNEIKNIGQNSRGIKTRVNNRGTDYYGFIRSTKCTAVIVECAFVDNKTDIAIIDTAPEQRTMGIAIAKGILKTLGISEVKQPEIKTEINENDIVSISDGATYYNGKAIPAWVRKKKWIVKSVEGDRAVIDKSADGTNSINSPVNVKYLTKDNVPSANFKSYLVSVNVDALNIRKGPGTNYGISGVIRDKGTYTIIDESGTWGKLKSGAGWISLNYCIKK